MTVLSHDHLHRIAGRARALADPTRLRILQTLARQALPVGQIAAALAAEPSTISKHLQVLFREGLVARRRVASAVIYSIADAALLEWLAYLASATLGTRPRRAS
jgi:DNA-binding transcriptional ArsR family regulator